MRFMAIERVNLYFQFAFLLNIVRFFFTELLNVEAKVIIFVSMFNNSTQKSKLNLYKICTKFSDLMIYLCPYISIKNHSH